MVVVCTNAVTLVRGSGQSYLALMKQVKGLRIIFNKTFSIRCELTHASECGDAAAWDRNANVYSTWHVQKYLPSIHGEIHHSLGIMCQKTRSLGLGTGKNLQLPSILDFPWDFPRCILGPNHSMVKQCLSHDRHLRCHSSSLVALGTKITMG